MLKGQIISGEFGKIIVRQKSTEKIELGELLIAKTTEGKVLLQVYDLLFGSQISQQNLELISGLNLEENSDLKFMDKELRNYTLALLKPMLFIGEKTKLCKTLPNFFSEVCEVKEEDLKFITRPNCPIYAGKLRSGSKQLNVDISLPGDKVFSHHVLIAASTGKGKSNLMSVMLYDQLDKEYAGVLVLDPHDEYYKNLQNHPKKENFVYYTPRNPPPGQRSLIINIRNIKPQHFNGVTYFSDAQQQALSAFYKKYREEWIEAIILEKPLDVKFYEDTLSVIKRKLLALLDVDLTGTQIFCNGIFDLNAGQTTIKDIRNELELGKTVVIDTSSFGGSVEILIGSLITTEIFNKYKYYKTKDQLSEKPVISIVLEEAPRVLGKAVLEQGPNIFSTIAREGRKFKIGLTAITQLPSLIPRQILANINTKIILGIEMAPERQAIIESASQDLSTDNRNIASLDKGEAIISSTFTKFAIPIKIPLFQTYVKENKPKDEKLDYSGININ